MLQVSIDSQQGMKKDSKKNSKKKMKTWEMPNSNTWKNKKKIIGRQQRRRNTW